MEIEFEPNDSGSKAHAHHQYAAVSLVSYWLRELSSIPVMFCCYHYSLNEEMGTHSILTVHI